MTRKNGKTAIAAAHQAALFRGEALGFRQGVAYAVAELLRMDEPGHAKAIWEASGCDLRGVDDFDGKPIRKARSNGWLNGRI